jgi:hypothetical protein
MYQSYLLVHHRCGNLLLFVESQACAGYRYAGWRCGLHGSSGGWCPADTGKV